MNAKLSPDILMAVFETPITPLEFLELPSRCSAAAIPYPCSPHGFPFLNRRASAEDMSRALDGEIVPMEALSPAMQSDLEGEEEGTYVMVHTDPASNRSFSACVWKVRWGNWLSCGCQ